MSAQAAPDTLGAPALADTLASGQISPLPHTCPIWLHDAPATVIPPAHHTPIYQASADAGLCKVCPPPSLYRAFLPPPMFLMAKEVGA